jgi:pimeloyl-ACP methyl ester carboxylesterase
VHYVVLRSVARNRKPDPVFMLAGGPGQSAIGLAAAVLPWFERLLLQRDLVLVDQRGTGKSAPLMCPRTPVLPFASDNAQAQSKELAQCRADNISWCIGINI